MIKVIVAFFSPSGYKLPKRHLQETFAWLRDQKASVMFVQVVRDGEEPQPCPPEFDSRLIFRANHAMFFKENLWNIAARASLGDPAVDSLLFLDSDVSFTSTNIATAARAALAEFDVIQPFETAVWLDREQRAYLTRPCSANGLRLGAEPAPGIYHPGFAWAMTRSAFLRMGGWYEGHPFGGGDCAFVYSLDSRWLYNERMRYLPEDTICWHSNRFRDYQKNGVEARLKVGFLPGIEARHQWHGSVKDRQYVTRCNFLKIAAGEEYPTRHRPDGLLEWNNAAAAAAAQAYFDSRKEDG